MNKVIVIKDPHFSFRFQNRIRKNYERDITEKLEFISQYAIDNSIQKIIFTGDVFDNQFEYKWSFRQFKKNKSVLEKYFIDRDLELWSVAGNHDFFHGQETIKDTVFGEMVEDGIINYLTEKPLENIGGVTFYGVDWSADKNKVIAKLEEINSKSGFKAVVIHMNVTEKSMPFTDFTYEFLSTVFNNIDIWILGHYHMGSAPIEVNGKIFVNPWSLTRVVRDLEVRMDKYDVNMSVIELGNTINVYDVSIPHRSFREAFIEDFVNMLQVGKKDVFEFFKNINIEKAIEETDNDEQLIEKLVKEGGISEAGKLKALRYLNGE